MAFAAHYLGRSLYCHPCYARSCGRTLIAAPFAYLWRSVETVNWSYCVLVLGQLRRYLALLQTVDTTTGCTDPDLVRLTRHLVHIFGPELPYKLWKPHLRQLLLFADVEARSYGFDAMGFSQTRMERECPPDTMDFWLTLCVTYDLGHYLADLEVPKPPVDF